MAASDIGRYNFKKLMETFESDLNEADTRAKIIDPIFKECLGWDETDFRREVPINKGFLDYTLRVNDIPIVLIESKEVGSSFTIPVGRDRKYKLNGTITTNDKIKKAIEQIVKYSYEIGTNYSVISNGKQFLIFQNFIKGGKWRDGFCTVFRSWDDIFNNFTLFWNLLSKNAVMSGTIGDYLSDKIVMLDFKRPYDSLHSSSGVIGKNKIAGFINPLKEKIFEDLTDESQLDVLENCYIRQKSVATYDNVIKQKFDKLPHYAKKFEIDWFKETDTTSGKFEIDFKKCQEILKMGKPKGSLILLLGGIGSGKTTFIHHFFKIIMRGRDDIIPFFIDFSVGPPEIEKIESFIYQSILTSFRNDYKNEFKIEFQKIDVEGLEPIHKDILLLIAMLTFEGYTVSLILDNVDHHAYTTPLYQERLLECAQKFTHDLKTITMLNLREESFFKVTKSGVLDAYHVPTFHISSPYFENLIRARMDYTINLLDKDDKIIYNLLDSHYDNFEKNLLKIFFIAINNSIREEREEGIKIINFVNNIAGGDMRQALRLFNTFLTSGNTDVEKIFRYETSVPKDSPPNRHYNMPLHEFITSIMLGDYKYYNSLHSFIINIFQVSPQYTNSHFIHLKLLKYLNDRKKYYVALDEGYVLIQDILYEAEIGGLSSKAISTSFNILADNGLIEYDNQKKDGYESAYYVKITQTGEYYLKEFVYEYTYLNLISGDTLICEEHIYDEVRRKILDVERKDKIEKKLKEIEKTELFINYLKQREENDFKENPSMYNSHLTNIKFMDKIIESFKEQKEDIIKKMNT